MFDWFYNLLLSFVGFVLSFFGIQLGSNTEQTPLKEETQTNSSDVPVETIGSEEEAVSL
jgi:uncharacterized membrane protein